MTQKQKRTGYEDSRIFKENQKESSGNCENYQNQVEMKLKSGKMNYINTLIY